jgi:hypothetical protein
MNFVAPQFALAAAVLLAAGPAVYAAKPTNPLNDTGAGLCIDVATNTFTKTCAGTGQDGEFGRDVTNTSAKDGKLGFSFAKVCNSGEVAGTGTCPAGPVLGTAATDWGCTQDKVTGLVWEIKVDTGLRKFTKNYTNLGNGANTDASGFVAAVNNKGLCGAKDWRLPTVGELQSIVNYGVGANVDLNWFPRTRKTWFWTSDIYAGDAGYAWLVYFGDGSVYNYYRGYFAVRLVRTGQ